MISERLMAELNEQIKHELFSSHLYLAMAAYCHAEDLPGFANFFTVQAEEERFHSMKFFNYIKEMDGRIRLTAIDSPINDFSSMLEVFQKTLEHEQFITSRIYKLMDIATDEREHATISMLKWFIDEQVQEESMMSAHVKRLKRIGSDANGLLTMDAELALRTFTPPAPGTVA